MSAFKQFIRVTTIVLALVGGAGKVAADPLPPGVSIKDGYVIVNAKQVLAAPMNPVTFRWQVGWPTRKLPFVGEAICVLTAVSGKFMGAGERIALFQQNGRWMLGGTSGQKELAGEATCVQKYHFLPAAGNLPLLTSTIYGNHTNGSCADHIVAMPDDADARAFFLTGVAGKFRGGGEQVTVYKVGTKGGIKVNACSGYVDGTLASFGDTSTRKAFYRNAKGERVPLGSGSQVTFAFTGAGPPSKSIFCSIGLCGLNDVGGNLEDLITPLAPVEEALCGLTMVGGKLQGYGEEVKINQIDYQGRKWWNLNVRESGDDALLRGAARCITRDQRPLVHFPD